MGDGWGAFRRHSSKIYCTRGIQFLVTFTHLTSSIKLCFVATKQECKTLDIQFHLLHGSPGDVLPGFVSDRGLGAVLTDFYPLREPMQWLEDVKKALPKDIPLIQVKTCTQRGSVIGGSLFWLLAI